MTDTSAASFCAKCGRAVPLEAEFCAGCGTRIRGPLFDTPGPPGDSAIVGGIGAATFLPNSAAPSTTSVGTSAGQPLRFGEGGFRTGDQIGPRYTILKLLGTGGMGAVYQAFDHELGVGLAIKVIRPTAQADATAARDLELRFKRELVLARQITHRHVVRIHDIGDIDGIKYLTMPYIEGETLADVLRRDGKLPVARALLVARQVAAGLTAAHDKGIVHRDLKPENIMIEQGEPPQGGDALIMDFGIARTVESGSTQTAAGAVIGTIEYMAPEQAQGKKVDTRADIYAFGLILYDTLVGKQRVKQGESPMSELLGRFQNAPPPARSLNGDVPEALDRIVGKCLEPAAENRYQTTHAVVAALDALTPDGHSRTEASGVSTPAPRPQEPAKPVAPPLTSDPDVTFAGRPNETVGRPLDVTFAGAPGAASGRPEADNVATIGPTPAASGGTRNGPIEVGQQFGSRYHIIRELGVGGMGAVYQAWDAELGVAVAVKVIRAEIASNPEASAEIERRFKRELLLARQVTHPNVVRIHDLGDINGIKYITMTYIEGSDLSTVLNEHQRLPVPRALQIARGVVAGLVAAHEAGVVHRDLKPANIMIGVDDVPTIMDFGIARAADSPQQASVTPSGVRPNDLSRTAGLVGSNTQAGAIVGTVAYMAPEQASGKPVDQRADIYAFGLILYDMLIGGRRREGAQSAIAELVERMQTAPPAPRTIDATIPEAVDAIIRRCVEPDPANRFQTTVDLHAAFERLDDDGKPLPMIRRLTRRGMALSAAAVLLLVAGTFFVAQWLSAPPVVHDPISVLVAEFQNNTGDAVFNGVLEQAFSLGLEGATFITAYPQREAQRSAAAIKAGSRLDEQTARLVAVRDGVKVVLVGSVGPAGSGYTMSVKALDAVDGKQIASVDGNASVKDEVLNAVGEMAARMRRELGDTESGNSESTSEPFTTTSLEAASAYVRAQDLNSTGKFNEAIAQYQEAVQRDPNFGRAYSGWANAAFRAGRPEEADQLWKKAITQIERMTEREKYRTLGGYYLGPGANDDQALENYRLLVEKYPLDGIGMNNLAVAYFRNLDFKRAYEQGEKATAIYANGNTRSNLALYAMYASNFDAAAAEARKALEITPFDKSYLPIAIAALAGGKPDEARAAYDQMAKVGTRGASIASMGRADVDMYLGRFAAARAELETGAASDDTGKLVAPRALKLIALAEVAAATGRSAAEVSKLVSAAVELSSADAVLVPAGRLSIGVGRADVAAGYAATLEKQVRKRTRAISAVIRAEMSLASKKPVEAIDILTAARSLADLWLVRFTLGRAYVEQGRFAEAVAEFDECQKRIGETADVFLDDWPTFRYSVPLKYWLGRAQEGLGIKDAAAKNYQAYIDLRSQVPGDALATDARKRISQ
jgi:eukaryotic-like serine/threonine-protein kinase